MAFDLKATVFLVWFKGLMYVVVKFLDFSLPISICYYVLLWYICMLIFKILDNHFKDNLFLLLCILFRLLTEKPPEIEVYAHQYLNIAYENSTRTLMKNKKSCIRH